MKKLLLPLLAVVAITFSAAAQTTPASAGRPQRSPQEMAGHQTKRLTKALNLTSDQATKVEAIMASRAQEMQALRGQAQAGTDRSQLRDQMQANRAKYDDQLKQVLTPEQLTKYAALEAKHGQHGRGMKDGKMKAKDGKVKIKTS